MRYLPKIPDDLASCPRCRDLIILVRSRSLAGQGFVTIKNPSSYEWVWIKRTLTKNWQGRQMPSGSWHRSNCVPFDITARRKT